MLGIARTGKSRSVASHGALVHVHVQRYTELYSVHVM